MNEYMMTMMIIIIIITTCELLGCKFSIYSMVDSSY